MVCDHALAPHRLAVRAYQPTPSIKTGLLKLKPCLVLLCPAVGGEAQARSAASCMRKVAAPPKLPTLPRLPRETKQAHSSDEESADRPVPKARSWVCRLLKGSAVVAAVRAAVRS